MSLINFLKEIISPNLLFENSLEKATHEVLLNTVKTNSKWLDIGCGMKPYAKYFSNAEYIGIDIEESGRPNNMKAPDKYYDGVHIPYESSFFDGVLCTQVLEHVEDLNEFLAECNRILKPGGSFVISVPFLYKEHEKPYDFRRFTSFGIVSSLSISGFQNLSVTKLISSIETIASIFCIYIDNNISEKGRIYRFLASLLIIIPTVIIAKILSFILPDNRDLYLCLLVSCIKKDPK